MKKFEKADFEETNILRRWLCAGRNLGGMIVSNIDDARANRVLYSKKLKNIKQKTGDINKIRMSEFGTLSDVINKDYALSQVNNEDLKSILDILMKYSKGEHDEKSSETKNGDVVTINAGR